MGIHLNLRTAALLVIGVVAVIALYPDAARYLPYLLFAACPVMMFLMMRGHGSQDMSHTSASEGDEYRCPMHPGVRSSFPAKCPRCGMNLEPRQSSTARSA
jgi:hypothetical protein